MIRHIFILLFCFCVFPMAKSQKTDYAIHWANREMNLYTSARIEPNKDESYYCILSNNLSSSNSLANLDSIRLANITGEDLPSIKLQTYRNKDLAICHISANTCNWAVNLTAKNQTTLKGSITVINTATISSDLLVFCQITGDSLTTFKGLKKVQQLDLPESTIFCLLRINRDGEISIVNYWNAHLNDFVSRLVWADQNTYCIFLSQQLPSGSIIYPISQYIPKDNLLPDSIMNGCFIQYDFKNNQSLNTLMGYFPILSDQWTSNSYSLNSKIILAGVHLSKKRTANFQSQKFYKINSSTRSAFPQPKNYNENRSYLAWMILDIDSWKIDQIEYLSTSDTVQPFLFGYGILKNGYWFLTSGMDSICLNGSSARWNKLSLYERNLISYIPSENKITSLEFPQNVIQAYSDGDSLIFVCGDNSSANPNVSRVDMDGSSKFKYPLNKGKYSGQYFIDGRLAWARNEDITTQSPMPTIFVSKSNQRFVSPYWDRRTDIDYGFRKLQRPYIGDYSGSIVRLSKAPISDFDIEHAEYNHITLNYKGALNSNFYYKYGDGSKDSNMNQRWILHTYQKKGKYLIQCISFNNYGRDTAFYAVEISEIVSSQKIKKHPTLNLYPNPTQDFVSWDLPQTQGIDIYNSSGAHLQHFETNASKVDIKHLPPGIYIITINTSQGHFFGKIIKE